MNDKQLREEWGKELNTIWSMYCVNFSKDMGQANTDFLKNIRQSVSTLLTQALQEKDYEIKRTMFDSMPSRTAYQKGQADLREEHAAEIAVWKLNNERLQQSFLTYAHTLRRELIKKIDEIYPPTFVYEDKYGEGILERGKQEEKEIRRLTHDEKRVLDDVLRLLEDNKK